MEELIVAAGPEAEKMLEAILVELLRVRVQYPDWPADPVQAAEIVEDKVRKNVQEALDFYGYGGERSRMADACTQVGAMSLRFLTHLHVYHRRAKEADHA